MAYMSSFQTKKHWGCKKIFPKKGCNLLPTHRHIGSVERESPGKIFLHSYLLQKKNNFFKKGCNFLASQRHIGGVKAKEEHIALLNGIPYILLKMIPGFDWALYRVQSESGIVFFFTEEIVLCIMKKYRQAEETDP